MNVVWDIDGVLADLTHGLTTLAHDWWGTPIITGENQPTWSFRNAMTEEQQAACWEHIGANPSFWNDKVPSIVTPEDILSMRMLNHYADFIYLTNRNGNAYEYTRLWLERNSFPAGLLAHTHDKVKWIQDNIPHTRTYAIDDAPYNILSYKDAGIPVTIMDRPYNADISGHRVRSVQEFVDSLLPYAITDSPITKLMDTGA